MSYIMIIDDKYINIIYIIYIYILVYICHTYIIYLGKLKYFTNLKFKVILG